MVVNVILHTMHIDITCIKLLKSNINVPKFLQIWQQYVS